MNLEIRKVKDELTQKDNIYIIIKSEQNDYIYRAYRNCIKLLHIKSENNDHWITFECSDVIHQFKITDFNIISFIGKHIELYSNHQIKEILTMLNEFNFKEAIE